MSKLSELVCMAKLGWSCTSSSTKSPRYRWLRRHRWQWDRRFLGTWSSAWCWPSPNIVRRVQSGVDRQRSPARRHNARTIVTSVENEMYVQLAKRSCLINPWIS
jgi:hypothetical protein